MNGKGILYFPDGKKSYEGDWLDNKMHGKELYITLMVKYYMKVILSMIKKKDMENIIT